jgi:NADPH:quinone reductase-like Zn-dependent oxidoreductase
VNSNAAGSNEEDGMKAIVHERYGSPDVIELREIEKPVPQDNEILVKVMAASLNKYDWHFLTADVFFLRFIDGALLKPKNTRLGADIAGRVEAVGKEVKQFKPGDEVFGGAKGGSGGFAEYVCSTENGLALKPAGSTFEEAAAAPMAALTALQGLRDQGKIQAGQKVLVNGASGGVGTFAVQIAKAYGAEVTAVTSPRNLEAARSLGADHVIDYTQEDFTRKGQQYDLIFVANGYHPISAYKRALCPNGICVLAGGGSVAQLVQVAFLGMGGSKGDGKKIGSFMANYNQKDLQVLKELIEAGKVKPAIDRRYPLSETAEAMRYLGAGHARAKVVITMEQA